MSVYGATNQAFESDIGPASHKLVDIPEPPVEEPEPNPPDDADIIPERPEDERESWDSKLTFLLATIG